LCTNQLYSFQTSLFLGTSPPPPSSPTLLRNIVSPRPPCIAIYSLQCWEWQYLVKAKLVVQAEDMLTPTGYVPPPSNTAADMAHSAHSQHCGHTALSQGRRQTLANAPAFRTTKSHTLYKHTPTDISGKP